MAKDLAKKAIFTPVPSVASYITVHINFSTTNFLFNFPLFASYVDEVAFWEGLHLKPTSLITYKTNRFVYIP